MENLQVTAYLSNGIAVYDDWSPSLDNLLIDLLLKNQGINTPDFNVFTANKLNRLLRKSLPLQINKEPFFCHCSSPVYKYTIEDQSRYRKRWSPDQDGRIDWGKRKAKFSTSEGAEKSYDLPLFIRLTPRIDWFCVGDKTGILDLLQYATGLGKKRSLGFGQVAEWKVTSIKDDWSIIKDGKLTKPLPVDLAYELGVTTFHNMMIWGWRPPAWLERNKVMCMMPEVVSRC